MKVKDEFLSEDYLDGFTLGQILYRPNSLDDEIEMWTIESVNKQEHYVWYDINLMRSENKKPIRILCSLDESSKEFFKNREDAVRAVAYSIIWENGKKSLTYYLNRVGKDKKIDTYLEDFINDYPEYCL